MKVHTEFFHTESEARAFLRGVAFVEHPDLWPCGPKPQEGFEDGEENAWIAAVHDNSDFMPDDRCPVCGSRDSDDDDNPAFEKGGD